MIAIRDEHLEKLIDRERQRRGDSTQAKTLSDMAREYITRLEQDGVYGTLDEAEKIAREALERAERRRPAKASA